jgi:membrane-associated phospholipid phosphatase
MFLAHGMIGAGFGQATTRDYSFPSSHATLYFSLLLPVAWQFPKYRWALLVLPVLITVGRLVLEEHFLGDVLGSICLVGVFTWLFSRLPFITPRTPFRLRRPFNGDLTP